MTPSSGCSEEIGWLQLEHQEQRGAKAMGREERLSGLILVKEAQSALLQIILFIV